MGEATRDIWVRPEILDGIAPWLERTPARDEPMASTVPWTDVSSPPTAFTGAEFSAIDGPAM